MEQSEDQPALSQVINSDSNLQIDDEAPCYAVMTVLNMKLLKPSTFMKPQQQYNLVDYDKSGDPRFTRICATLAALLHRTGLQ